MTKWLEYIRAHGKPRSGWLKAPLVYQSDIRHMRRWLDRPPLDSADWNGWTPGRTLGPLWSPVERYERAAWWRAALVNAEEKIQKQGSWNQLAEFDAHGNVVRGGWARVWKWESSALGRAPGGRRRR